jgi:hypothetical protein
MTAFENALRVILETARTHKAVAVAEQSTVADEAVAQCVHFLNNVRQARMAWEREFADEH